MMQASETSGRDISGSSEFTEQNDSIGLTRGEEYSPLTNFNFKFVCKVTSPDQDTPEYNGFIVGVETSTSGGTRTCGQCFFPWHKTQQKGLNISKELGSAVPERSLISRLKPSQLMDIFWSKLMDFESDPDYSKQVRKAIITLGRRRQPDSDVIVLAPSVHVNEDGIMIPYREQEYLWVEHIVKKECVIPTGLNFAPPPECDRPLNSLLEGLQKLTQGNFLPAVFVLGSVACSLFYEQLHDKYGSCGVTIVVGDINRGKTKSVELSLAALGVRYAKYSSITNALLRKLLLGGMPWCFDDPDDAGQLMRILLSVFGGSTMGNVNSHGSCRVSPLATANMYILQELAAMDRRIVCRARIVPFDHQLEYNLLSTSSINHAFDLAPAAGPCLVNIGHRVASTEPEELTAVQSHISDVLPELDSRGTMEYTLLLTSAIAVASATDMIDVDMLYDCFDDVFVPVIRKFQVDPLVSNLGTYILSFAKVVTVSEILRVVNPNCTYTVGQKKGICGVAVVLKEFLRLLNDKGIEHDDESVIRHKLRRRNDVRTTATQFFLREGSESATIDRKNGDCKSSSCIIIPQSDMPQGFFVLMDSALYKERKDDDPKTVLKTGPKATEGKAADKKAVLGTSTGPKATEGKTADKRAVLGTSTGPKATESKTADKKAVLGTSTGPKATESKTADKGVLDKTSTGSKGTEESDDNSKVIESLTEANGSGLLKGTLHSQAILPSPISSLSGSTQNVANDSGFGDEMLSSKDSFHGQSPPIVTPKSRKTRSKPLCKQQQPSVEEGNQVKVRSLKRKCPVVVDSSNKKVKSLLTVHKEDVSTATSSSTPSKRGRGRPKKTKKQKENVNPDQCPGCKKMFVKGQEGEWSGCDMCVRWWHWACTGLTESPISTTNWACPCCCK